MDVRNADCCTRGGQTLTTPTTVETTVRLQTFARLADAFCLRPLTAGPSSSPWPLCTHSRWTWDRGQRPSTWQQYISGKARDQLLPHDVTCLVRWNKSSKVFELITVWPFPFQKYVTVNYLIMSLVYRGSCGYSLVNMEKSGSEFFMWFNNECFVNSVNTLWLGYLLLLPSMPNFKIKTHRTVFEGVAFYLFNKIPHHLVIFPHGDKGGGIC